MSNYEALGDRRVFPDRWRCSRCGCVYEGREVRHAFTVERQARRYIQRLKRNSDGPLVLQRVCNPCLNEARYEKTKTDPFLAKAQNTRRDHAKKLGFTIEQMIEVYGWADQKIVKAFAVAWEDVCPYCGQAYKGMRGGIQEMTVDIINPRSLPFWTSNVNIICRNDNSTKRDMPPEEWEIRQHVWRKHTRHTVQHPKPAQLALFDMQAAAA